MSVFAQLWPGGPAFAQAPHFRLSTDSILLADFVPASRVRRGIDLGCGAGLLSVLLLARTEALHMSGLELDPDAADLARENLACNDFAARGEIHVGDIRCCRTLFPAGSFDLVVANPPYYPAGSGKASPEPARAAARTESTCSLEQLCAAAAWLLADGGRFCLVHKPERLPQLLGALHTQGLEPKRLRLVCHSPSQAPALVLVEGRRNGRPGLQLEPVLFLRDAEDRESPEYRRIYHRDP